MSGVKRYIEQMEADEAMHDWISEHVDFGVVEGDPEWEEEKKRYLSGAAFEMDLDIVDYDWLTAENIAFSQFDMQMNSLKDELPDSPSLPLMKMTYSYMVTLMETCLSDMIKSLVLEDEIYLKNAIGNITDLKKRQLSLADVFRTEDVVKKVVLQTLSDYLYHNVEKVVPLYSAVLGEKTPDNVRSEMPHLIAITKLRHDIVHRNGNDKEGNPVLLDKKTLTEAMDHIHSFVRHIKVSVDAARMNMISESEF